MDLIILFHVGGLFKFVFKSLVAFVLFIDCFVVCFYNMNENVFLLIVDSSSSLDD